MPDAEQQELLLAFVEEGRELLDESDIRTRNKNDINKPKAFS